MLGATHGIHPSRYVRWKDGALGRRGAPRHRPLIRGGRISSGRSPGRWGTFANIALRGRARCRKLRLSPAPAVHPGDQRNRHAEVFATLLMSHPPSTIFSTEIRTAADRGLEVEEFFSRARKGPPPCRTSGIPFSREPFREFRGFWRGYSVTAMENIALGIAYQHSSADG